MARRRRGREITRHHGGGELLFRGRHEVAPFFGYRDVGFEPLPPRPVFARNVPVVRPHPDHTRLVVRRRRAARPRVPVRSKPVYVRPGGCYPVSVGQLRWGQGSGGGVGRKRRPQSIRRAAIVVKRMVDRRCTHYEVH